MTRLRERAYRDYRTTHSGNPLRSFEHTMSLPEVVRQFRQRWVRHLPEDKSSPVLDFGCGAGQFLYFLQEENYTNLRGIDVSPEQIDSARALGLDGVEQGNGLEYLQAHTNCFKLINAQHVLEHFDRDELGEVMDAMVQALIPGGRLFVVGPNASSFLSARVRYSDITHELAFTPSSVVQLCSLVGLRLLVIAEHGPLVHGIMSAVRWFVWQWVRLAHYIYLLAEIGGSRYSVYTQDLMFVAERPKLQR